MGGLFFFPFGGKGVFLGTFFLCVMPYIYILSLFASNLPYLDFFPPYFPTLHGGWTGVHPTGVNHFFLLTFSFSFPLFASGYLSSY